MGKRGILYGVGVGPGDPDLLTFKAAKTIAACPVIASPRTPSGGMVALDIARQAVDLTGKTTLPLDFAMSHDADVRAASHRVAAAAVRTELEAGRDVAILNLGDVSIYASFHYIAAQLADDGFVVRMIPGVASFSAVAAALGISLTEIGQPLHLIPDGRIGEETVFALPGTKVWMKSGRHLTVLLDQLRARGVLGQTMMVQHCGLPDERVYHSLEGQTVDPTYFTIVILKDTP